MVYYIYIKVIGKHLTKIMEILTNFSHRHLTLMTTYINKTINYFSIQKKKN